MKRKCSRRCWAIGICVLVAICGLFARIDQVGILNLFNRRHCFSETRELTNDVVIELSRQTFLLDGLNIDDFSATFVWARDMRGSAYWTHRSHDGAKDYIVTVERNGSQVCCRALHPK